MTDYEYCKHSLKSRTPKTTARRQRSPVQAVHIVGPFAVLVPVSVVHHQHLLLRLQHFLKDAEKHNGFYIRHKKKKERTFCSSPTPRQESSPCTTAARDSRGTPWSPCITSRPKAPGTLRTRRRYHWYRKVRDLITVTTIKCSTGKREGDDDDDDDDPVAGDSSVMYTHERTLRRHRTSQLSSGRSGRRSSQRRIREAVVPRGPLHVVEHHHRLDCRQ